MLSSLLAVPLSLVVVAATVRPLAVRPVPTVWIVGLDTTASVNPRQFARYPDMLRAAVLRHLKLGDTVVLVPFDRPEESHVVHLEGSTQRLRATVASLDDWMGKVEQVADRTRARTTDVGAILRHTVDRINLDHRTESTVAYRLVYLSDGVPTGKQSVAAPWIPDGGLDWRIAFLGVSVVSESRLRAICTDAGFRDASRIIVVPFALWEEKAADLSGFLGRAPNPTLERRVKPNPRGGS